jgi:hypothetical protein
VNTTWHNFILCIICEISHRIYISTLNFEFLYKNKHLMIGLIETCSFWESDTKRIKVVSDGIRSVVCEVYMYTTGRIASNSMYVLFWVHLTARLFIWSLVQCTVFSPFVKCGSCGNARTRPCSHVWAIVFRSGAEWRHFEVPRAQEPCQKMAGLNL